MATPDTAFIRSYQDSIMHLVQQKENRLRRTSIVDTDFKGEQKSYEQYGADSFTELSGRYEDTPLTLPNHQRRTVFPSYFVSATLEDPKDAKQMLIDPKSAYMQGKMFAANRRMDDTIVAAMGGNAFTGKNGTTSTAFSASFQVGVQVGGSSTDVGLNKAKVLRAKRLLDAQEVESENRFATITARQLEDLLNITEVTNADFHSVKNLVEGTVSRWVGFDWIQTERLLTDANSDRLCYFYQQFALKFAINMEPEGRVTERPDKNYAWQVYMRLCIAATRMEEERIVQVACDES